MKIRKGYTFDDVLLVPKKTDVSTRDQVDLSVDLGKDVKLDIPIISANMKTVTGPDLAAQMVMKGGLGILHRFTENRIADYKSTSEKYNQLSRHDVWGHPATINYNVGVSVGIADSEEEFLKALTSETDCKIVCVDIAHAHSTHCLNFVEHIAKTYPKLLLIAGNVATGRAAEELAAAGADVIKVGIGGGSICSTRGTTGNGVPQLTAIMDAAEALDYRGYNAKLISDGGIKKSGHVGIALCFADAVMLGTMLAGCDEAPGTVVEIDGHRYKEYVGSSTYKARYIEGITSRVACKGPLTNVLEQICDGVRSCCSYQGVFNLDRLKDAPEFIELSSAGIHESTTHAVIK